MFGKNLNKILIFGVFGAGFLASFLFFDSAHAALVLPQTDCDDEMVNYRNANGNTGHLLGGMTFEDGTKAFSYGKNFTLKQNDRILVNVNLRFVPDDPLATIKLLAFDDKCNIVFGFSPVFHNLDYGENFISFDPVSNTATYKGETPSIVSSGKIRYFWIEVMDKAKDSAFKSYSYLIDTQNPRNPTGTVDEPTPDPKAKRPVLIIPGIMGSELYDGDELIWPNINKIVDNVNDYFLVESLSLDQNGGSIKNIETGKAIESVVFSELGVVISRQDILSGLVKQLKDSTFQPNVDYFFFPYDWRLDLDETKSKLYEKIESIKNQTHFDKIDIIAHSMGGLLVEDYVKDFSNSSINKLVFVGTPHLGAPKAAYALMQGDLGIPLRTLNSKAMRDISLNSPSAYELLPNKFYHEKAGGYYRKRNGDILSYQESLKLLKDQKMNTTLVDRANNLFEKDLTHANFSTSNVYNISGCKVSTPGMFHVTDSDVINGISYLNGDGTVPLVSSKYISADKQYYVKGAEHSELPSKTGVKELILSILTDSNFSASNISTNTNFCDLKGKKLTWRSPVEVHIYDSKDNHAGPVGGQFENNIPGVSYEIIDGEKFIFLPTDENQKYRIEGTGLESGKFDLLITDIENEVEGKTQLFDNVEIVSGSLISFRVEDDLDSSEIDFKFTENFDPIRISSIKFSTEGEAFEEAVTDEKAVIIVPTPQPEAQSNHEPSTWRGDGTHPDLVGTNNKESGKILGEAIDRLPDETLVLDATDHRTVYLIENGGKKYGFTTEKSFLGRGYKFKDVISSNLDKYKVGGLIIDTTTKIKQ
ncbi:MAG: alpha/beta hydrolase [Candidatus Doudnabacteria bacterium]|nr:alpha/beta hydrolase [Candidatus Doudnabacteria bacterium]